MGDSIAETIWSLTKKDLGTLELSTGTKIQINLDMYAAANLSKLGWNCADNTLETPKSRINMTDRAFELLKWGLHLIAASMARRGADYTEFRDVCRVLVEVYKEYVAPAAMLIEQGKLRYSPPTSEMPILSSLPQERINEVRQGMLPVLRFLESCSQLPN